MMRSMTGMGRARGRVGETHFIIEAKSINHRFCEVYTRLPSYYQALEPLIVQLVKEKIGRGKVDIWLGEEKQAASLVIDYQALRGYYRYLQKIKQDLHLKGEIEIQHLLNGSSFWSSRKSASDKDWPAIKIILNIALDQLIKARQKEGTILTRQLRQRLQTMISLHQQVQSKKSEIVALLDVKLKKRIETLLGEIPIDESKLANELAYLADRTDVTEELDRLRAHYARMKEMIAQTESVGRSLDFLIQEINREWNTIASKTQNAEIAHWVVQAKSEMEKIREQIQNIE